MMTALYAPDLLTQVSRRLLVQNFVRFCLGFTHLKYSSWCFSHWFLRKELLFKKKRKVSQRLIIKEMRK